MITSLPDQHSMHPKDFVTKLKPDNDSRLESRSLSYSCSVSFTISQNKENVLSSYSTLM